MERNLFGDGAWNAAQLGKFPLLPELIIPVCALNVCNIDLSLRSNKR